MSRAAILALGLFAVGLWSGCSFTFDGEQPAIPLVGAAPATARLPALNRSQATTGASIMFGRDGVPWAFFGEVVDGKSGVRVVRLAEPAAEEVVISDNVTVSGNAYYSFDRDPPGQAGEATRLRIRSLGQPEPGDEFVLPPGPGLLVTGGNDGIFMYWPTSPETKTFLIQWRDRSYARELPVIEGVDPEVPTEKGTFFFSSDARYLYTRDGTGRFLKHATRSTEQVDFGVRPSTFAGDGARRQWVFCGEDGLHAVKYDASSELVLDPEPCEGGVLWFHLNRAMYLRQGVLYRVPLDGSGAPEVAIRAGQRVMAAGGTEDLLAYSLDPGTRYILGAGDGWLGDWRFMERGRNVSFSRDNQRVRWLEHAAKSNGIGDLYSAELRKTPVPLALNVRAYDELSDGRVLASSNRAYRGMHNRVILIDENAGVAHWVASQAADYTFIPGSTDLLIDVVSGATGFDIVRVPIPPR